MSFRRVALTGIGVVAPGSIGVGEFREQLGSGVSAIAPVERFDTSLFRSSRAALLGDFQPKRFIAAAKMRRMNYLSRIAMSATKLALDDSRFQERGYERPAVGVAVGTVFGPVQTSLDYMDEYIARGPALAPPQLFAESVANAPGSHMAIDGGFEGFNVTFTQREGSALTALLYASSQLVKGSVEAAIVGGVDEMNEVTFGVLDRIGALARPDGELDEALRPFDRRRNGLVVGEGGVCFTLENRIAADADSYCDVSGFGIARDATATISDWGSDATSVCRAMERALSDADLTLGDVDAIFASANGSLRGDRLEAEAIQQLFGSTIPPVVAVKGYFGEYAAAGGLQLAAAALAVRDQSLPLSAGFEEPDEGMTFEPTRTARSTPLAHVLVNAVSAGGGVVSAVLSRRGTA